MPPSDFHHTKSISALMLRRIHQVCISVACSFKLSQSGPKTDGHWFSHLCLTTIIVNGLSKMLSWQNLKIKMALSTAPCTLSVEDQWAGSREKKRCRPWTTWGSMRGSGPVGNLLGIVAICYFRWHFDDFEKKGVTSIFFPFGTWSKSVKESRGIHGSSRWSCRKPLAYTSNRWNNVSHRWAGHVNFKLCLNMLRPYGEPESSVNSGCRELWTLDFLDHFSFYDTSFCDHVLWILVWDVQEHKKQKVGAFRSIGRCL